MLRNLRALNEENHTGEDVGDRPSLVRADCEDALLYALEETHRSNDLRPFRDWVRKYAAVLGMDETRYRRITGQDSAAWFEVDCWTCNLSRMNARYERSANRLLQAGFTPPAGRSYLPL